MHGINGVFFRGWWIYIRIRNKDYAINFRHEHNDSLVEKAMQFFPCGIIPLKDNFETWAPKFAKQFAHKGFKGRHKQGLAKCYCRINDYGKLIDIMPITGKK